SSNKVSRSLRHLCLIALEDRWHEQYITYATTVSGSHEVRRLPVSIVVEDFHKNYDKTIAVAGISFQVEAGEILGLVGPNGAGKTTTLRALAGILRPTRGRIVIAGHDLAQEPVA